jgi:hypothetical protein
MAELMQGREYRRRAALFADGQRTLHVSCALHAALAGASQERAVADTMFGSARCCVHLVQRLARWSATAASMARRAIPARTGFVSR